MYNTAGARDYKTGHFLGVVVLLGLFVPHTSFLLMLINPILLVLLSFFLKERGQWEFDGLKTFICVLVMLSTMTSALFFTHQSNKYLLTSLFLFLLISLFPFVGGQKIPGGYYLVALILILFSQLVYLFNVPVAQRIIETLYPVGEEGYRSFEYMTENINTGNIFDFRLGGLFRNPNQSARYTCLITAAFLADRPNASLREVLLYIILSFGSVLFTGSRTGLVVYFLLVLAYVYKNHSLKRNVKVVFVLSALIFVLPLFIGGGNVRGFNVSQGFNDSANSKWYAFVDYLNQDNSIFHLLFGYGDMQLFRASRFGILEILDSEYGNMVFTYGFLGLFLVVALYYKIYKIMPKETRFFYIILLWVFTSTVLLSYRMSFLFMLFLSHLVALRTNCCSQKY